MENNPISQKFFNRFEAAGYLKVSTKTIDRLIRDNRIKAFKLGKRVLIYSESLTEENINAVKPTFHNSK